MTIEVFEKYENCLEMYNYLKEHNIFTCYFTNLLTNRRTLQLMIAHLYSQDGFLLVLESDIDTFLKTWLSVC